MERKGIKYLVKVPFHDRKSAEKDLLRNPCIGRILKLTDEEYYELYSSKEITPRPQRPYFLFLPNPPTLTLPLERETLPQFVLLTNF